jgi:uncharacterized membrane protein
MNDQAMSGRAMLAAVKERIEDEERWDVLVDLLDERTKALGPSSIGRTLRGEWLGHALHPLLTDLPLGCWLGAGLLDLTANRRGRSAARRLVGLGLIAAVPAVAAGLAEYTEIENRSVRRVAAVHAAGNSLVALCYHGSWLARRRDHHARGVVWGLAGGGLAWGTGYLGGHLSFARGIGQGERPAVSTDSSIDGSSGSSTDSATDGSGEQLITVATAADILETRVEAVREMIDRGLLTPMGEGMGDEMHVARAEVASVRLMGG